MRPGAQVLREAARRQSSTNGRLLKSHPRVPRTKRVAPPAAGCAEPGRSRDCLCNGPGTAQRHCVPHRARDKRLSVTLDPSDRCWNASRAPDKAQSAACGGMRCRSGAPVIVAAPRPGSRICGSALRASPCAGHDAQDRAAQGVRMPRVPRTKRISTLAARCAAEPRPFERRPL
jgi:hypothetical protein